MVAHRILCFVFLQFLLASNAFAQTWFYQSYDRNGPSNSGYVTLDDEGGKTVFRMSVPGLGKCYKGVLNAVVAKSEATTVITITPESAGCEEVRFVIKNDGTGGQRELKASAEWRWDGTHRGLTKLERTSSAEALAADVAAARKKLADAARQTIVQPGPDVPADCASFVGGWFGNWGVHGGESWLWVVQVDANCVAKYGFGRAGYWGPFETTQIQKGMFSKPCAQGGTCFYTRHGDELWASYQGPRGVTSATYKRIQIEAK